LGMGPGTCLVDHGSGAMGDLATEVCVRRVTVNLPQSAPRAKFGALERACPRDLLTVQILQQMIFVRRCFPHIQVQQCRTVFVMRLVVASTPCPFCTRQLRIIPAKHDLHHPCTPHVLIDGQSEQSCSLSAQSEHSLVRLSLVA
jgi:hypothetical protein